MQVRMWKFFVLSVLWTKSIFGYEVTLSGKGPKELSDDDELIKESIAVDPKGNILELKGIYYTTGPRSRVFVEYPKSDDVYLLSKKLDLDENSSSENEDNSFQPWSILWYIGSFGGLIAFFLVVSCSEWCCRTHIRDRNSQSRMSNASGPTDMPPPAYDLFAPPSYDSLCRPNDEKGNYDVFVVPVHTLESLRENEAETSNVLDSPPSYSVQSNNEVVLNVRLVQGLERQPKSEPDTSTHT